MPLAARNSLARDVAPLGSAQLTSLLASIVECSDDAIVAYDPDGTLLSWNRGAEAIFGYSSGQVLGRHISFLVPQERHVNLARFLDTLLSGRSVSQYRGFGLCRDGRRLHVSVTGSPILNHRGEVTAISTIIRDISGRYAAEQARALLAAIVETSDDAICSVTTDGDILSWNRAAQELFGYTAEEATTRNVAMLALPSDREETASFIHAVRKETTISSFDTVLVHKDGGAVEVSVSISPLCTPEGLPAGASVIIRDARRRRESERRARDADRRFRGVFERSPFAMAITTADGTFLQVNQAYAQMLGYSEEELHKASWRDLTHPDDLSESMSLVEQMREAADVCHEVRKRFIHRSGAVIWARVGFQRCATRPMAISSGWCMSRTSPDKNAPKTHCPRAKTASALWLTAVLPCCGSPVPKVARSSSTKHFGNSPVSRSMWSKAATGSYWFIRKTAMLM